MFETKDIDNSAAIYEVFDAIEIRLSNSHSDDEPVQIDYDMTDFDGQFAKLTMNLSEMSRAQKQGYDKLMITFNDADGAFTSANG